MWGLISTLVKKGLSAFWRKWESTATYGKNRYWWDILEMELSSLKCRFFEFLSYRPSSDCYFLLIDNKSSENMRTILGNYHIKSKLYLKDLGESFDRSIP